jgi:hypothetical protein
MVKLSETFKTNTEQFNELRVRLDNLESEVYYLKNHPLAPKWRCTEVIDVDDIDVAYRCEYNTAMTTLPHRSDYRVEQYIIHEKHVVHLSLKTGQRIKIEWRNVDETYQSSTHV